MPPNKLLEIGELKMNRTSSFGLWRFASEYFNTFELIEDENKLLSPRYYLLGHGIELVIKAFLITVGVTERELKSKSFGHNLGSVNY